MKLKHYTQYLFINRRHLCLGLLLSLLIFNVVKPMAADAGEIQIEMPILQWLMGNETIKLTGEQMQKGLEFMGQAAVGVGQAADEWFRGDREGLERNIRNMAGEIARYERQIETGNFGYNEEDYVRRELAKAKSEKEQSEKNLEALNEKAKSWGNLLQEQGKQGMNLLWDKMREKGELKKVALANAVIGDKKNQGAMERLKEMFKKENLIKMSGAGIATFAGITTLYYSGKLGYNYIDSKIGRPTLVRESTRHDWKNSLSSFWNETILGNTPPQISLDEVILQDDMAQKLRFLADDTHNTMENGLPFRHVLFYGLPGTGKTMFAKRLARHSGMDYAIMSGADFAQFANGQGITELHKLFDWAENSKNGLLIFVDEADAFLRDRRVLDNQGKNLVNAFLSRTGTSAKKYMLVFATNYEDELDVAALSRIHKKVYFPLPALTERMKILNLYMDKYIVNDVRKITREDGEYEITIDIPEDVNETLIKEIAQKIDGFSGREIEQMVSELRISAYNIGNGALTKEIINNVVNEKIEEHKHDAACAKQQRARAEKELGQSLISM